MANSLRDPKSISGLNVDICAVCGTDNNLKVCSRCKSVAYCSKDHQTSDWPAHKVQCKRSSKSGTVKQKSDAVADDKPTKAMELMTDQMNFISIMDEATVSVEVETTKHASSVTSEGVHVDRHNDSKNTEIIGEQLASILPSQDLSNKVFSKQEVLKRPATEDVFSDDSQLGGSSEEYILQNEETSLISSQPQETLADKHDSKETSNMPSVSNSTYLSVVEARNKVLSDYIIKCLNSYGLCVFDNFLGESKGTDILNEVQKLYNTGKLTSGQLVNTLSSKDEVRGDVITWVDGSEKGCSNIHSLISSIDAILLNCQNCLGHYKIKGRSKAMVAVYPANSTGFLRHVDNPSGDGRCVTCIYYLNKNWNSKTDGGLLRIFPEGNSRVANVEPKFDRILFFWSDRRNPHEVLPSFRERYAVTVWYFDSEERKRAVKRFKSSKSRDPKSEMVPLTMPMQ
uniref:hypoxia-inducible factor-proline dioxygenase n=1 Tax=Sinonovacula constricta TaxID=98310 RepID=A0AA96EP04_SINCO|nr:prolyl 4-hydroxylase 2A [Sinonovacula constricta]